MSSNEPTPTGPAGGANPPIAEPERPVEVEDLRPDGTPPDHTGSADDVPADDLAADDLALYREHLRAVAGPVRTAQAGLLQRVGAEALGTFALVIVTLAIALYGPFSAAGALGTALGAGLVLIGTTAALGRTSGGHFNPAVTLGATLGGRLPWLELPAYWLAQLVGGVAAGAVVFVTIPTTFPGVLQLSGPREFMGTTANGWDAHSPLSALSQGRVTFGLTTALAVELVGALVLVAVYLGTTRHLGGGRLPDAPDAGAQALAPVAIGVAYAALLLMAAPITGGALNPARSTAAALFAETSAAGQLWLFWVAPLVGAALAGLGHTLFARPTRDQELAAFMAAEPDDDEPEVLVVTTH